MKFVAGLTCHLCGATYPAEALWVCSDCLGPRFFQLLCSGTGGESGGILEQLCRNGVGRGVLAEHR